jgi:hypothetical protein
VDWQKEHEQFQILCKEKDGLLAKQAEQATQISGTHQDSPLPGGILSLHASLVAKWVGHKDLNISFDNVTRLIMMLRVVVVLL